MTDAETGWSVTIDRERCMGSGLCITYAPGVFEHDAQAKAVLRDTPTDGLDEVRLAVEACPTGAIQLSIHREEGAR